MKSTEQNTAPTQSSEADFDNWMAKMPDARKYNFGHGHNDTENYKRDMKMWQRAKPQPMKYLVQFEGPDATVINTSFTASTYDDFLDQFTVQYGFVSSIVNVHTEPLNTDMNVQGSDTTGDQESTKS